MPAFVWLVRERDLFLVWKHTWLNIRKHVQSLGRRSSLQTRCLRTSRKTNLFCISTCRNVFIAWVPAIRSTLLTPQLTFKTIKAFQAFCGRIHVGMGGEVRTGAQGGGLKTPVCLSIFGQHWPSDWHTCANVERTGASSQSAGGTDTPPLQSACA